MQWIFKVGWDIVLLKYFMLHKSLFASTAIKNFHLFSENTIITLDILNSLYVKKKSKVDKNNFKYAKHSTYYI